MMLSTAAFCLERTPQGQSAHTSARKQVQNFAFPLAGCQRTARADPCARRVQGPMTIIDATENAKRLAKSQRTRARRVDQGRPGVLEIINEETERSSDKEACLACLV